MRWIDTLNSTYHLIVDTTIKAAANTFNVLGSLSCMAGGASLVFSYIVDERLNASLYGSANTTGQLFVTIDSTELNFKFNETIPFQHLLQENMQITYHSRDYLEPHTVFVASMVLTFAGGILKLLSANIGLWQRRQEDQRYMKSKYSTDFFKPPSFREYLDTSASSLCSSLAFLAFSSAVLGCILQYSKFRDARYSFTYPSHGSDPLDSTYYKGPITSTLVPITLDVQRNVSVNLPIDGLKIIVQELFALTAVANTSYGGGLFFSAHNSDDFPVVVPAVIVGTSAYLFGSFFETKLVHQRDERLLEASTRGYGPL